MIRWRILSGDKFPVFDHVRLEDTLGSDFELAAGKFESLEDVERHLAAAHKFFLDVMLLIIGEDRHSIARILPTFGRFLCCFDIALRQCYTKVPCLWHRCGDGDWTMAEENGWLSRSME
jgi:hypothetical protein